MAWDRYIQIVVNLSARGSDTALQSVTGKTPLRTSDFVQADTFPLRLVFVQETGNSSDPLEIVQLEPGSVIVFSGKLASALGGGTLLYYADAFEESVDADGKYFYTGALNTNTAETRAAFEALAATKSTLSVINEVEIQNADNTARTSFQHAGILRRQVYNGEGTPAAAAPSYPSPAQLFIPGRDVLTAEVSVDADHVDFAVPSAATTIGTLGILRPSPDAAIISVTDLVRVAAATVRASLSAVAAEPGYLVTIFTFVAPAPFEGEETLASALYEGIVAPNSSSVDIPVPSTALSITPLGVELPAVTAAPISIAGVFRLSATVARVFLSAAPAVENYKARIHAPTPQI